MPLLLRKDCNKLHVFILESDLAGSEEAVLYVNTGSKHNLKKGQTYCGRLVERLGIGIWTQVAVDVWAREAREGDRVVIEQGAAGLRG